MKVAHGSRRVAWGSDAPAIKPLNGFRPLAWVANLVNVRRAARQPNASIGLPPDQLAHWQAAQTLAQAAHDIARFRNDPYLPGLEPKPEDYFRPSRGGLLAPMDVPR